MTAQIIDLSDAVARERRRALRIVRPGADHPARTPLADLIAGQPFDASPAQVQSLREIIAFATACGAIDEAKAAIEEFLALPTASDDAHFVRDSLALGFAAVLEQRCPGHDALDQFSAELADRLFPIFQTIES